MQDCKIPLLVQRTRPMRPVVQARRVTIGYIEKYKHYLSKFMLSSFSDELRYVRQKKLFYETSVLGKYFDMCGLKIVLASDIAPHNFCIVFISPDIVFVCKIPLLARRTRPKGGRPVGQARRATIGYLVYKHCLRNTKIISANILNFNKRAWVYQFLKILSVCMQYSVARARARLSARDDRVSCIQSFKSIEVIYL